MNDPSATDEIPPFEILSHRRIHDGFLKLDLYEVIQPTFDGGRSPPLQREIVRTRSAVAVLCYDPERDAVVIVEQLRMPAAIMGFSAIQTEIVAGLTDADEPPEAVAVREVREETALEIIGPLVPIARTMTTPGHSTETVDYFCARVDAGTAEQFSGRREEHEDIRVLILSFNEFKARIMAGSITNNLTLIAGLWLLLNKDAVRSAWGFDPR
jgi:ADP-ribose pyrophosphatase